MPHGVDDTSALPPARSAWYVVYVAREDLPFALRRRSVQHEGRAPEREPRREPP